MKITNNIATKQIFKGYDAAPLKALHISSYWTKIGDELENIANKENFELEKSDFNETHNQDSKAIVNNNGNTRLIYHQNAHIGEMFRPMIEKQYRMPVDFFNMFDFSKGFIQGGNFFLGKKQTGEKWMLIGSSESIFSLPMKSISKLYGVKEENIFLIDQQDYHLDLSIRPIGYPYVLINEPQPTSKNKKANNAHNFQLLAYKKALHQLKNAGFHPISIKGVYGYGVNFINAVVNKHQDGSITYITNSSKCDDKNLSKYQDLFEKELKSKLQNIKKLDPSAPTLRNIYFIRGESYGKTNEVMENLIEGAGGVHCMCLEEPDFDIWV